MGVALGVALAAGGGPAIGSLEVGRSQGGLSVRFDLEGVWSAELLERVQSGLELTFRHRVELVGKRIGWIFPRRTLARTVVETTLRYDSLTQRYEFVQRVVARRWAGPAEAAGPAVRRSTDAGDEARRWMTRLEGLPLPAPEAVGASVPVRVRIRSELDRKLVLGLFPWTRTVSRETLWGS